MDLTREFILFQQEGYLIKETLCTGLTALRNTQPQDKGGYYNAFFNLSIGLERLLKVAIVIDHMIRNSGALPSDRQLRDFGHNLTDLYGRAAAIAGNYPEAAKMPPMTDPVTAKIVGCLSDFARKSRYYNLDELTTGNGGEDPLARWHEIVAEIFLSDVPPSRQALVLHQAEGLGTLLKETVVAVTTDLNQRQIGLKEAIFIGGVAREANPYVLWQLIQMLEPLRTLLRELSWALHQMEAGKKDSPSVPYMHEFLSFVFPEKKTVLKKKRWP